jgi:nitroreductase
MNLREAIEQRQSVRAFLERPVEQDTLVAILETARWAPSGVNMQPWRVAVVQGATQQRLGDLLIEARRAGRESSPDIPYYPQTWFEPYRSRRRDCGLKLYSALDIKRDDAERQMTAWCNNYRFFGAPVGLVFHLDAELAAGSLVDMGLFLQTIMLYAQDYGLATCPQASLAEYPDIVREVLGIPAGQHILCGMALGYPDWNAPVNQYRLERATLDTFTTWHV